jgi:hypothetical protein
MAELPGSTSNIGWEVSMATEVEGQPFSQPDSSASGHRFNDDLLMNPGDLDCAQMAVPNVAHVLDNISLRNEFRRFDVPANAAHGQLERIAVTAAPAQHDFAALR